MMIFSFKIIIFDYFIVSLSRNQNGYRCCSIELVKSKACTGMTGKYYDDKQNPESN